MKYRNTAIAIVAILIIGISLWLILREPTPTPPPAPLPSASSGQVERPSEPATTEQWTAADPLQAPEAPQPDPVPVAQAVQNSDEVWREAASELMPEMPIDQWLSPEQQLRRWVALVDQMAEGQIPAKHRPLGVTVAPFAVDKEKRASGANYTRTQLLVDAFTSIPPASAARYYQAWQSLFEEAYRELGKPGSFDARLRDAIKRIAAAEPAPTGAALAQPSVFYRYADPALENRDPLTKALWRLGPENQAKVQEWVKRFGAVLQEQ